MGGRRRLIAASLALGLGAAALTSVGSLDADEATATGVAERTSLPDDHRRPKVFLAFTGTEGLLSDAADGQWTFVRANLDGLWGNTARMSADQAATLTNKVLTRDLVIERDIAPGGICAPFAGPEADFFTTVEQRHRTIRYERLGAALYAGRNPDCWGASGGIGAARREYQQRGYLEVWSLFQPQNTSGAVNNGSFPTFGAGSSGDVAHRTSDAVVLECPIDACLDPTFGAPFWAAMLEAHARDVPFVWYTANSRLYGVTSGWLQRIQSVYQAAAAAGLWRPDDAIVIVHNTALGAYRLLPERDADGNAVDSLTGILYWLLRQEPVTTLCTSRVAC